MSTFALADELQADKDKYVNSESEVLSLDEYLNRCKEQPDTYATAQQRLLKAIGEPQIIATRNDPVLGRVFDNRDIAVYPGFKDFYGMEDTIEEIVSFLRHASQGLEESKQILYLLGPVGSAKSSIAERLKALMEDLPIYTLAVEAPVFDEEGDLIDVEGNKWTPESDKKQQTKLEFSPVNESPLGLFAGSAADKDKWGPLLQEHYGIKPIRLSTIPSPWATEWLKEFGGDKSQFKVVKRVPSTLRQIAISKTEPGDENNQDISALVGKVNMRKLATHNQDSPKAYSFSGGLCLSNQGLMEFVEMFKAPIKVLHPLLTATQEKNYKGTEGFGAIPFDGLILAHSNESEWDKFSKNPDNVAFLARTHVVRVPYTLRVSQEMKIYEKWKRDSELVDAPTAPNTLEMMAQLAVMSRLMEPDNSSLWAKMKVYDGENLTATDPKAKRIGEYRKVVKDKEYPEGMSGVHTRWAFKALSATFNYNAKQPGFKPEGNPVHLLAVLDEHLSKDKSMAADVVAKCRKFIEGDLKPRFAQALGKDIKASYQDSYGEYGQNVFDRYVILADVWLQEQDYRDPDSGEVLDRAAIEKELSAIEKPAGVANPKDFRNEVVNFVLRARAKNNGNNPSWTSYEKMREVIEKKVFDKMDDLLPMISFTKKATAKEQEAHDDFVKRMGSRGYTPGQTKQMVAWYEIWMKNNPA
jgi:serine protein kinase